MRTRKWLIDFFQSYKKIRVFETGITAIIISFGFAYLCLSLPVDVLPIGRFCFIIIYAYEPFVTESSIPILFFRFNFFPSNLPCTEQVLVSSDSCLLYLPAISALLSHVLLSANSCFVQPSGTHLCLLFSFQVIFTCNIVRRATFHLLLIYFSHISSISMV